MPLRNIFRKMKISFPAARDEDILALAVKAMNDTIGPEGYVSSALVFGEYPRIFTKSEIPTPRDTALSRAKMVNIARDEVSKIMARLRVDRALKHSVPPSSDKPFKPGD